MKLNNGREVEELPKNMAMVKKEFEKNFNFYKAKSRERINNLENEEDKKRQELEDYALMFGIMKEFYAYLMNYEEEISVHIKDLFDELNIERINLGKYGKKLFWDEEAKWLYFTEMQNRDWIYFDKDCNTKYLQKRNNRMFD